MEHQRPRGLSLPRVIFTLGLFAALALVLLIARAEPPRAGEQQRLKLRAQETSLQAADGPDAIGATIRRDPHGIPHILADDFKGLGFGYGYAFAEDNICTIAESYVTVRAERSRYFGPDSNPGFDYTQNGNGFHVRENRNSDFFYQRIIDNQVVEDLLAEPPPRGPEEEIKQGVRGYVAGYNKWLADTGVENISDPRCRGADWVQPITEMDVHRRFYQLALLASSTIAIDAIAEAQPPAGAPGAEGASGGEVDPEEVAAGLGERLPIRSIGSNAYGLGAEATTNGKGVLLGNPHFPWDGPERLYQSHLTIPGEVNVMGGSLYGVPLVLIGTTDNFAWSHTVSTAYRFTPFEETLNPADPTQYLHDGEFRPMTTDDVTITVKNADGSLSQESRTLYSTHHGPVITSLAGVALPWTNAQAFTMGDVNAANFRYLNHFFFTNQAQSVEEYDEIQDRYQGIPWVNSIATDSSGTAYYADKGAIPNVPDSKAAVCNTPVGAATFAALRLPVLNGATSQCDWEDDTDQGAAAPGILPPSEEPSLFRDDYVANMNDSYWLSNPEEPLTGYARIIGDENTARTLRTRIGIKMLQERFDDQGAAATLPLDRRAVQEIVFNNRQYAGELWRDELVQLCETAPGGQLLGESGPVDVSGACPVLASWNLHDDFGDASRGAILFRQFARRALNPTFAGRGLPIGLPTGDKGAVFTTPFNPLDPVNTPSGLNAANPVVQKALADAVAYLNSAGVPLDATLESQQFERSKGVNIPIHGGPGGVGVFNAINVPNFSSAPIHRDVPHGSSFVIVTQFSDGCADPATIVTYGQSEDVTSPYYDDQTHMFSRKEWVEPPFCEDEVQAELGKPGWTVTTIDGCLVEGGCEEQPPADADDDGIPDAEDDCPDEPGIPENAGCPEQAGGRGGGNQEGTPGADGSPGVGQGTTPGEGKRCKGEGAKKKKGAKTKKGAKKKGKRGCKR